MIKNPIIIKAKNLEFNRKILDQGKFDILLSPETEGKKDSLKYLDSGLNHIMARIASKQGIAIGIDLENLRKESKKQKAIILARIMQNIRLCRKANVKMNAINMKNSANAQSLFISLGSSTTQAKEATI